MSDSPAEQQARERVHQTLLGSWRIDRFVSLDKAVAVYEATDATGRRGLVKLLHAELSRDAGAVGRFLRESRIAGSVRHPQVMEVFGEGRTDDGCACAVVRLLDGATCKAVAEGRSDRKLEVEEVLHIAERALEGLGALHAKGVLHANLKPDKLFWTRDGDVVLVGLGNARLFGPMKPELDVPDPKGAGTAGFMPPEQALGEWERLDARSDLWALGATMFQLLTGQSVRRERNAQQQLLAAMTRPAPGLASVAPDMPEGLCGVVDGALVFDQKGRWPHSRAMLQAVRMLRAAKSGTIAAGAFETGTLHAPFVARGPELPFGVDSGRSAAAATPAPPPAPQRPSPRMDTGTLHGGHAMGRPIVPFGGDQARDLPPSPLHTEPHWPNSTDAAHPLSPLVVPVVEADPQPARAASSIESYAELKVAQMSDPSSFPARLRARGLDEIGWRLSEARLSAALDQEARAGWSATALRLAQAMHLAARGAEGG